MNLRRKVWLRASTSIPSKPKLRSGGGYQRQTGWSVSSQRVIFSNRMAISSGFSSSLISLTSSLASSPSLASTFSFFFSSSFLRSFLPTAPYCHSRGTARMAKSLDVAMSISAMALRKPARSSIISEMKGFVISYPISGSIPRKASFMYREKLSNIVKLGASLGCVGLAVKILRSLKASLASSSATFLGVHFLSHVAPGTNFLALNALRKLDT
mmetsp:Transcript_29959/g.47902  ORF Transcript_29959/g.47902 Transcript_29959/m.47902 type:complete len:213 (-) Transcript_29959:3217-3855(-)